MVIKTVIHNSFICFLYALLIVSLYFLINSSSFLISFSSLFNGDSFSSFNFFATDLKFLKALDELYEKQEGVPYNISLGGGTQGLAETINFNYMLNPTRVYPLEKYFAGSFIGYLKTFKIYSCFIEQGTIYNNFMYESKKFNRLHLS